jgi:hypothetical protein
MRNISLDTGMATRDLMVMVALAAIVAYSGPIGLRGLFYATVGLLLGNVMYNSRED